MPYVSCLLWKKQQNSFRFSVGKAPSTLLFISFQTLCLHWKQSTELEYHWCSSPSLHYDCLLLGMSCLDCGHTIIRTVSQHCHTPSRTNSIYIGQGHVPVPQTNNPEGIVTAFLLSCTFILATGAQMTIRRKRKVVQALPNLVCW